MCFHWLTKLHRTLHLSRGETQSDSSSSCLVSSDYELFDAVHTTLSGGQSFSLCFHITCNTPQPRGHTSYSHPEYDFKMRAVHQTVTSTSIKEGLFLVELKLFQIKINNNPSWYFNIFFTVIASVLDTDSVNNRMYCSSEGTEVDSRE